MPQLVATEDDGTTLDLAPPKQITLRLNSQKNARKSLARVIREFVGGRLTEGDARTIGYLLTVMLAYFRVEQGAEVEERLIALEQGAGLADK